METGSRMLMGSTGYHARGAYCAQSPPELYIPFIHSFTEPFIHLVIHPSKSLLSTY